MLLYVNRDESFEISTVFSTSPRFSGKFVRPEEEMRHSVYLESTIEYEHRDKQAVAITRGTI